VPADCLSRNVTTALVRGVMSNFDTSPNIIDPRSESTFQLRPWSLSIIVLIVTVNVLAMPLTPELVACTANV
jgi:hypothetical protein